jgi:hypothetical protein
MEKIVYQTDAEGFFVGAVAADPSPLEPGVWLIPGGAVETTPPALAEGERARWTGIGWEIVPPPEPEPEPYPEPEPEGVPQFIQRHQGLLALLGDGTRPGITEAMIREAIAAIADPVERERTRIRFEQQTWRRDSEFIAWGMATFGLDDKQTDGLFTIAATL